MKKINYVTSCCNNPGKITINKNYELIDENLKKFCVKNNLGEICWLPQSDFYYGIKSHEYGFEFLKVFDTMLVTPGAGLFYDKQTKSYGIIIFIPFVAIGLAYTFKPKF